jgi:hypothetical protein
MVETGNTAGKCYNGVSQNNRQIVLCNSAAVFNIFCVWKVFVVSYFKFLMAD